MKTLDQFREFYDNTLIKELNVLELERKKTLRKVWLCLFCLFCVSAAILLLTGSIEIYNFKLFIIIASIIIGVFIYFYIIKTYVSDFKEHVIKKIVSFIDPELIYSSQDYVNMDNFNKSRIFANIPDKYIGNDKGYGKLSGIPIEFSEIHAQFVPDRSEGKHFYQTIFQGLFFTARLGGNFSGITVVSPNDPSLQTESAHLPIKANQICLPKRIEIDNTEIKEHFIVFSSNEEEAQEILSAKIINRLVDFSHETGKKVYISFISGQMFVAIPYEKDILEPPIFHTLLDFNLIKEYFEDVELAIGIVEDLSKII